MTAWISKLAPLAAMTALACTALASQANVVTYSGDTTTAPTYNRPLEDLSALSGVGTAVHYNAFTFSASLSGTYSFVTTGAFADTFSVLYQAPFVASAGLTRALVANDDLFDTVFSVSGFTYDLVAGTSYTYVSTGFSNTDFGAFTSTIGGPGVITAAVPEPEAVLMLLAGLGAIAGVRLRSQARREHDAIAA